VDQLAVNLVEAGGVVGVVELACEGFGGGQVVVGAGHHIGEQHRRVRSLLALQALGWWWGLRFRPPIPSVGDEVEVIGIPPAGQADVGQGGLSDLDHHSLAC